MSLNTELERVKVAISKGQYTKRMLYTYRDYLFGEIRDIRCQGCPMFYMYQWCGGRIFAVLTTITAAVLASVGQPPEFYTDEFTSKMVNSDLTCLTLHLLHSVSA